MSSIINTDQGVRRILEGICDRSLPKEEWTHEAHLAAAIAILSDSRFEALNDMPQIIKDYNEATGVRNTDHEGYNHTITIASLFATQAVMHEGTSSLSGALHKILASQYGQSEWPLAYWSKALLFSVEARKAWVGPNLKNLPFRVEL